MNSTSRQFVFVTTTMLSSYVLAQGDVHLESGDGGMVVSDSVDASRIGRDVIARGGNAVDSAVATAFALAVTWPEAGNIGGGGFMMIRPANGSKPVCIDYRERAPMATRVDTYRKGESRYTRKVVGVPGTVRGLELAHKTYGRLPWKELVLPAARLALDGFSVDAFLARSANDVLDATRGDPAYAELHRVYGKPDGTAWKTGDVMTLPDLGNTLVAIAEQGGDGFYKGPVAEMLLKETAKTGGLIRKRDLDSYTAKIREPIIGSFGGYTIIGAPPPSSGGIALVQGLNMVEAMDLPKNKHDPTSIHLLAEISRRFFLDRARHLGDPDFVEIPSHLTTKQYARELVANIDRDRATDSAELASDIELADESEDTTHFSIIDGEGMAVSNTYTIEASWGSRVVVPGAGYLLNNEMGDFNWVKGYTDRNGYIGSAGNLIAPGKRMLSSQCPLIVTKDDRVVLVTGSPGGRTILNTVFNIVLNVIHFEMPAPLAVQSKRFHHQWMPDELSLEDVEVAPFNAIEAKLQLMGHKTKNRVSQGSAHTIWVDSTTGQMVGIADYRRGGRPAGMSSSRMTRWDFGGRRGGTLERQTAEGSEPLRWSNSIADTTLDGSDRLTIRRDAPTMPDRASVRFPTKRSNVHATIEFDGIHFAGESKNEKLQFAFTENDSEVPRIVASLTIARNTKNQVVVYGEALGKGATKIAPQLLSATNRFEEAAAVRLSADLDGGIYRIGLRRPTELHFTTIGEGSTGAGRTIHFGRLRAINDFAAAGEYVRIDAIEFSSN